MRTAPPPNPNSTQASPGTDVDNIDKRGNVFGTEGPATEFFAAPSYRPHQRETIEEIEDAFKQGYQYVVVDAPTGAGKSHTARAFSFQAADTHIITIQKLLQDQYQRDFPDMTIMKGRSGYRCEKGEFGETCANGPCRTKKGVTCETCPYKLAKERAQQAEVTVHNFDSFYFQNAFGGTFRGRKLLVVDEAHNISSKFSSFLSFTLDSRGGIPVPELDNIDEYDEFVNASYKDLTRELSVLDLEFEAAGLSSERLKRRQDLSMTVHKMSRYRSAREGDDKAEYVFDYVTYGRNAPKITFRPVYVGAYAARWLFNYGERVIMMSATILDKEMFCREVGLKPEQVYYVGVPSTFPPENRPIIKKYAGKMNYTNINQTLPRIADIVQEIADKYPERKGIIQTHSEKIAAYLQRTLIDDRFTYNKDYDSPQQMLSVHERKPGSIIIASGLREGLDLHGDLSKIQVFCKVPYPSLGDKLVKRKMELDERWYGWMTTVMFIQSLGRSVRSPKEKAVTYILDSGFGFFYKKNSRFIPDYIKESIKW